MIKLITPPGMLLTTALLAIYAVYAFLIGTIEDSWPLLVGGFLSMIACYGTAMVRPWSRWLVYLLTLGFGVKLGISIYEGVVSGYFGFQFGSVQNSVQSLLPSMLMMLISGVCAWLVWRNFKHVQSVVPVPGSPTSSLTPTGSLAASAPAAAPQPSAVSPE